MIDLGKYATYILGSYGATFVLIVGLIVISVLAQKRVRKQIKDLEK